MAHAQDSQPHVFGSFRFEAATGELRGRDRSIKLRPQAAVALELLLSGNGRVVSRAELRAALWPDERIVMFETSIAGVIRELRRALGDDSKAPRFIETVPRRGYRFVTRSTEPAGADADAARKGRRGALHFTPARVALTALGLLLAASAWFRGGPETTAEAPPITVAVLPFEDLTGSPAHRTLAETVPRELVGWLGGVAPGRLRVVDRIGNGAGSLDEYPPDLVISGSVRNDRGGAVVSANLLAGADGEFIWGEHYRRDTADVGLSAREVAARIADAVTLRTLPGWRNGSGAVTSSRTAAAAFQRGQDALAQASRAGAITAAEAFTAATKLDPGFSEAYSSLAHALTAWPGPTVTPDRVERARQAARRSIDLVPTNAVGHRVLGEIGLFYDRDWQVAGEYLERSIRLAPSDGSGHHSYAAWLSARGRHRDALREIDLAEALEPGSLMISVDVMFIRFYARDFEGTINAALRLKQIWPRNELSHRYIVMARMAAGDVAAAAAEARARLAKLKAMPDRPSALSDAVVIDAYWAATLELQGRIEQGEHADLTPRAMLNVQLGRPEAAFDLLEATVASPQFSYLLPYLGVSPAFDRMCGHAAFERLLRRLQEAALGDGTGRLPRCAAAIAQAARLGS